MDSDSDLLDRVQHRVSLITQKYPTLESALKNLKHEKFTSTEEERLVKEEIKFLAHNEAVI